MKKVKILTEPNPILRKKAKKIEKIDPKVKTIIDKMVTVLDSNEWSLGLAAPQIGESLRIIAIMARETRNKEGKLIHKAIPLSIFINPEIIKFSKNKIVDDEGCFSYPGYFGPVERPSKIRFVALTPENKQVKINASGLLARIVQHEIDHLNGILFIDRIEDKNKLKKLNIE